jgi:membrane fusion protein (multidrug efflux system)
MASPFSRTTRSLNADSYRRSILGLVIVMLALAAWAAWLFLASVALYEVSDSARLEVDSAVHPVQSPLAGRVVATHLLMGRQVQAGDLLIELDSATNRLQLNEEQSRLGALSAQLDRLRNEMTAQNHSLGQTRDATPVAVAEARARHRASEADARQTAEEARRLEKLRADGLVSDLLLLRAQAEAEKSRAAADALGLEIARLEKDQSAKETDRQANIENLKRQAAVIEGDMNTCKAAIERLRHEIERRRIRALASGRLGEAAGLRVGSVVSEGEKLGAIVPTSVLKVVAEFAPSVALGRIRSGQRARLRLEGFPWTEYGGVSATVSNVASEPRGDRVRVELTISPDSPSAIPLQHGLPGTVEVEVERVSPASLLLRAAGRRLGGVARASGSQSGKEN